MTGCADENPFCYFHSNEVVVGICALCLKERLLVLAAKQGHRKQHTFISLKRKPAIPLPKLFALSTFLHLLEPRRKGKKNNDDYDDDSSIASLEDSFISMKFEENGNASWDSTLVKSSVHTITSTGNSCKGVQRSMIEHCKRNVALRWRKRIEKFLHLAKGKRSNEVKCDVGIVSKLEGVKVKGGWIRSLTKRTTI